MMFNAVREGIRVIDEIIIKEVLSVKDGGKIKDRDIIGIHSLNKLNIDLILSEIFMNNILHMITKGDI